MFKTVLRKTLPNPYEKVLKDAKRKGFSKFLFGWNRGLGDIALGLYALVYRTREVISDAQITFVVRENLVQGFHMLEGAEFIVAPHWKRGEPYDVKEVVDVKDYDVVINWPDVGYWMSWQLGTLTPKLKWDTQYENLYRDFDLGEKKYVGMQVQAETNYGKWRNWPKERWLELIDLLGERGINVLLFGYGNEPVIDKDNVVDLRSKTDLFQLLSIIKHRCFSLVLPDSGISSMVYYLNDSFPIQLVSLWAMKGHGILRQNVNSPNPLLTHTPIMGEYKNLGSVKAQEVLEKVEHAHSF